MAKEFKSLEKRPSKGKPNRPNYLDQQIQSFGPNFLDNRDSFNMARDAERILRDLARGNVNIYKYQQQLSNPQLV